MRPADRLLPVVCTELLLPRNAGKRSAATRERSLIWIVSFACICGALQPIYSRPYAAAASI